MLRANLDGSQFGRTANSIGTLTAELLKLNKMLADPPDNMTETQRLEATARASTLHGMLTRLNNTGNNMSQDQSLEGFGKIMEWLETGQGGAPFTGGIPRAIPRPIGGGFGQAPAQNWGAAGGLGVPQGKANAADNALRNQRR